MAKDRSSGSLMIGSQGIQFTPFAEEICLQEDFEVSLVRLPATVHEITFPLCLVVACVPRNASVRPRTGGIPEWPLQQVP